MMLILMIAIFDFIAVLHVFTHHALSVANKRFYYYYKRDSNITLTGVQVTNLKDVV
jgi:hypothetical protein